MAEFKTTFRETNKSNVMEESKGDSADELEQLLELPMAQRIEAVSKDLLTREDKYREIDAHDLAEAIGVSDSWNPGSAEQWGFTRYAEKISVEEYAENNDAASELVYLIQDKVSADRFQVLVRSSSNLDEVKKPDFEFLTTNERALLEEAIALKELEANQYNGMCCIAYYSVQTPSGDVLSFEATIEDDGRCIDLKTPYDYRDGKFRNLDNCVTDSW